MRLKTHCGKHIYLVYLLFGINHLFNPLYFNTMQSKIYNKYSLIFTLVLIFISCFNSLTAQISNTGINFQAVARDKEQNAANNRKIYVFFLTRNVDCKRNVIQDIIDTLRMIITK
jgi:hypothetical protein